MGLFDKAKIDQAIRKAKDLAEQNKDTITGTVTKATAAIDDKTGGKYRTHLQKVDDATNKLVGTTGEEPPDSPSAADAPAADGESGERSGD